MASSDRVDAVYLNPRVVAHQLRQMRMAADSLVFDPQLPHVEDHYYLSSIHHPQLIEAFNRFLEEQAELVGKFAVATGCESAGGVAAAQYFQLTLTLALRGAP